MIRIHYTYAGPSKPQWHSQTVAKSEAPQVLEALKPIASELLVEHVTLDQMRNLKRPAPTSNAVRIK
jgi:hypothetical protein